MGIRIGAAKWFEGTAGSMFGNAICSILQNVERGGSAHLRRADRMLGGYYMAKPGGAYYIDGTLSLHVSVHLLGWEGGTDFYAWTGGTALEKNHYYVSDHAYKLHHGGYTPNCGETFMRKT